MQHKTKNIIKHNTEGNGDRTKYKQMFQGSSSFKRTQTGLGPTPGQTQTGLGPRVILLLPQDAVIPRSQAHELPLQCDVRG